MLCSLIARKTAGMHVLFCMDLALKLAPPTPAIFFPVKKHIYDAFLKRITQWAILYESPLT